MTVPDSLPDVRKTGWFIQGDIAEVSALDLKRAFRWQAILRIAIIIALAADLAIFPSFEQQQLSVTLAIVYTLWTCATLWAAWKSHKPYPSWLYPLADLISLTALMAFSGDFSDPNWSSGRTAGYVFLLVPVLASFQMRPVLTAASGMLAATCYAVGTGIGHLRHPYWSFTLLQALLILVVCAGCVLLSDIQRYRLRENRELAEHRLWLLDRIMATEEREQRKIAEVLHDGALQNVLAARHLIDEATCSPEAADLLNRADEALAAVSKQLRSSVRTLHPEVLVSGGLVPALQQLTQQASERGKFHGEVHSSVSSAGSADRPLYWLAREILENVVKHAQAKNIVVTLHEHGSGRVKLSISDDGIGISRESVAKSLASGHIGIASHRARIEGMGGVFTLRGNASGGTTVEAVVPVR
ncbi:sensor histidine kinase [Streptomyces osmaniensis]|uniref:ATP-binding protein n=1 Tax=Streptomyces osmaniensis TaxID=593134 RepID=A0ABP6Z3L2_9ACTN|nr:hypothetical protein KJK32_00115 [Streptomyces sp. JCM17656]